MKHLFDITNQLVTTLPTLEVNPFDLLAAFIFNEKFDKETQKDWQEQIGKSKTLSTLQELHFSAEPLHHVRSNNDFGGETRK